MRRFLCYGLRGMDRYGNSIEVEAENEQEALRKASPQLKRFADAYVVEELYDNLQSPTTTQDPNPSAPTT